MKSVNVKLSMSSFWQFLDYAARAIFAGWKIKNVKRNVRVDYTFEITK